MSVRVKLPDGSVKEYSQRMRASDVAADIGPVWPKRPSSLKSTGSSAI